MNPYYVVKEGQIVPRVSGHPVDINSAHYKVYIDAKNYKVSKYENKGEVPPRFIRPMWIIDVTFGGDYTIFCEHLGEVLTVMSLLVNLFPKQGPHRQ